MFHKLNLQQVTYLNRAKNSFLIEPTYFEYNLQTRKLCFVI